MKQRWSLFCFVVGLGIVTACGVPEGSTSLVSEFSQGACSKNLPLLPQSPTSPVSVQSEGLYVLVSYKQAPFRCEQKVQFFVKQQEQTIQVTARPVDMNPTVVAACDCNFDLQGKLGPFPAGTYTVEVYHKTDNYGSSSETRKLSTTSLTLQQGQ